MNKTRWNEAKLIFLEAIELPLTDQQQFLDRRCANDAELRLEIETLIASHSECADFIEEPAFSLASIVDKGVSVEGKRFGNYTIVSEIGHGGMGAVFLAERTDGEFSQQVAIKLMRPGLDSAEVRRRFLHERQILAGLEHPFIARLIDGGTTPDGLPFLVMEFVDGISITEYSRPLGLDDRLELFGKVCEAVAFAHRRLVIHRDIKPSNIFVTPDGTPKLLDFGIAKLLDTGGDQTLGNLGAFTPDYASPEQLRGGPITTASDVYSLGVLLHELLTGSSPYRFETKSAEEILKVICERPPVPASAAVSNDKAPIDRRLLAGDLETVILHALHKEHDRRYSSVEQFAADIRRFREGLPVIARDDTLAYRASRFVRRNRYGVAAAALIVITLVLGIVATGWQARAARRAHARAETIGLFLQSILSAAAPEAQGADVKVKDILADAAIRARRELADDPEAMGLVLNTLGRTYASLTLNDRAEIELRDAAAINETANGPDHASTIESKAWLGIALGFQFKSREGVIVSAAAVDSARKIYAGDHEDKGYALYALALNLLHEGDAARALPIGEEASTVIANSLGRQHGYYLATLNLVGMLNESLGRVPEAEKSYRETISLGAGLDRRYRIYIAQADFLLARMLISRGDLGEVRDLLSESRSIYIETLGDSNYSIAEIDKLTARIDKMAAQ